MLKKKLYRRWWIWVLVVILAIGAASAGNSASKDVAQNEDSNTIVEGNYDSESDNNKTENVKIDERKRDNSSAKEITLQTGIFIVGEDIPKGRYACTGDSSGNFIIKDKNGIPIVNEILGSDQLGVSKVTTNLKDGEEIKISGIKNVKFTPVETGFSSELGAGTWEVGLDIEQGKYIAEVNEGQGNFVVYDNGFPKVNEILDASGNMGVPSVTLNLKDGEIIKISSLNNVIFNKK